MVINNLLTGAGLADFLASMVTTFTGFAPLGIVLVAMLGSGWLNSPVSSTPGSRSCSR